MSKDLNLRDLESGEMFTGTIDGTGYSDTLKLSNKTGCQILNSVIIGGKEDCIDINRGADHSIKNSEIIMQGKYGMTIKGGAKNILISNCVFYGHGLEIDLGNWSDQSQERTRNITIKDCFRFDSKPIKVRCLWADDPIVINSNVKITRIHPLLLWFFKLGKKLGIA